MVSLEYPWPETPPPGEAIAVGPGIYWLSMPLPFQLDHINLWLLADGESAEADETAEAGESAEAGWTVVDTGIGDSRTRELWDRLFARFRPVKRVILTHYHPDHAGNADWICKRFGVQMWTTQGEYLTAHAVRSSSAGYTSDAVLSVFRKNGLDEEHSRSMAAIRGNSRYSALVPEFPVSYRRIIEGDRVRIGGRDWEAIVGHGHAPEHLSLHCEALNVVIAGDMLLSTISTNVSVWSIDPEGDPLRLFLQSIARYRALPPDVLVLPSHGKPFRGAHARVRQLEEHHERRFDELKQALKGGPRSAGELLRVLFRRPLDTHQTFFAMGEAIAHLHYLYYAGEARRAIGPDGVMRYATA